ncbi:MAG: hypothetical protein ACHQ1H_03990 [Nitrososphaerales archaeon]
MADSRIDFVVSFKIRNIMDLSFIEAACERRNIPLTHAENMDELMVHTNQKRNSLIICDLSSMSPEELQAITKLAKDAQSTTFGFYPHIADDIRASAKSLGIDVAIPRSAFRAKLNSVLG